MIVPTPKPNMHLCGLAVFISPDLPRRTLPDEVMPGIPWPDGFKAKMDAWMLDFFGTTNLIEDNAALKSRNPFSGQGTIHVNPRTYARLVEATKKGI